MSLLTRLVIGATLLLLVAVGLTVYLVRRSHTAVESQPRGLALAAARNPETIFSPSPMPTVPPRQYLPAN